MAIWYKSSLKLNGTVKIRCESQMQCYNFSHWICYYFELVHCISLNSLPKTATNAYWFEFYTPFTVSHTPIQTVLTLIEYCHSIALINSLEWEPNSCSNSLIHIKIESKLKFGHNRKCSYRMGDLNVLLYGISFVSHVHLYACIAYTLRIDRDWHTHTHAYTDTYFAL